MSGPDRYVEASRVSRRERRVRAARPFAVCAACLFLAVATSAETARRVVSLNPSLTAILVAIGAGDTLVGVDDWSRKTQPEVRELPAVGGLYSPSLEAVVGLAPDLVVLVPSAEQRDFRSRMAELGLPVLELDPLGFDDVLRVIAELGARVGREAEAGERVARIRAARQGLVAWAAERPRVRTVLVLQRDPLFVVGRGSFVDDMLLMAGGDNLAAEFGDPYPRVTREWLIAAAPEAILDSSSGATQADGYWARWPSLPAVAASRVHTLPDGVATLPGPYLDRSLHALARALHGPAADELFERSDRESGVVLPGGASERPAGTPQGSGVADSGSAETR